MESSKSRSSRIARTRRLSHETYEIDEAYHGIIIFDDLPQLKKKTLILVNHDTGTLNVAYLPGVHMAVLEECVTNVSTERREFRAVLNVSSKCWWMLPPVK